MSQIELLRLVVSVLNNLQIPYMLVGSYASSFYGEPRSTHDIDMVIDLDSAKVPRLVQEFDTQRYYLSELALREGRMANLIDLQSGDKVDFFLDAGNTNNCTALSRRSRRKLMDIEVDMASAEDTILAKLSWSKSGGGLKRQVDDVRDILRIQGGKLDEQYLRQQAEAWGLTQELTPLLNEYESEDR
ncbi:MAG: hypothetical protein R3C53_16845 [Pirellulaceae bacterium]